MCVAKTPKMPAAPVAPPERQAPQAPSQAAVLLNAETRRQRRQGYAALIKTPRTGLGLADTTATSVKQLLGG